MAESQKAIRKELAHALSDCSTIAPSEESGHMYESEITLCESENSFEGISPLGQRKFAIDTIALLGIQPDVCEDDRGICFRCPLPGVPFEEKGTMNVDVGAFRLQNTSTSRLTSSTSGAWNYPEETIILLDWDDTLCPTSCFEDLIKNGSTIERSPALLAHEVAVVALLQDAVMLGGVVIVTMAKGNWVEKCIAILMPEVGKTLKNLGIEIVGARTSIKQRFFRESTADCRNQSQYLKTKAILRVLKRFYGSSGFLRRAVGAARSWKNVVSIGDSNAERLALQDAIFHHQQRDKYGRWKQCRCKTVQLVEEPDLEMLTKENQILRELLPSIVHRDGDVDLQMTAAGLETRNVP